MNTTLFRNRIFAGVTKWRMLRWSHVRFRMSLNSIDSCPYKRKVKEIWYRNTEKKTKDRERDSSCVVGPRSTKDCGPPPEAGRETQQILRASKGTNPVRQTAWIWISGLQNCERINRRGFKLSNARLLEQTLKTTPTPNNRLEHTKTASWDHLHLHLAIISVNNQNREQRGCQSHLLWDVNNPPAMDWKKLGQCLSSLHQISKKYHGLPHLFWISFCFSYSEKYRLIHWWDENVLIIWYVIDVQF